MRCIKTGAHAWLEQYQEWVYGDAFELSGHLVLHLCYRGHMPARPVKHFTVSIVDHWFDDATTSLLHQSVLVSGHMAFADHGYDGVAC